MLPQIISCQIFNKQFRYILNLCWDRNRTCQIWYSFITREYAVGSIDQASISETVYELIVRVLKKLRFSTVKTNDHVGSQSANITLITLIGWLN